MIWGRRQFKCCCCWYLYFGRSFCIQRIKFPLIGFNFKIDIIDQWLLPEHLKVVLKLWGFAKCNWRQKLQLLAISVKFSKFSFFSRQTVFFQVQIQQVLAFFSSWSLKSGRRLFELYILRTLFHNAITHPFYRIFYRFDSVFNSRKNV